MNDEYEDLIALANMLITNLDYKEHEELIDRWLNAVSDGLSDKDRKDINEEYSEYDFPTALIS